MRSCVPGEETDDLRLEDEYHADSCIEAAEVSRHCRKREGRASDIVMRGGFGTGGG